MTGWTPADHAALVLSSLGMWEFPRRPSFEEELSNLCAKATGSTRPMPGSEEVFAELTGRRQIEEILSFRRGNAPASLRAAVAAVHLPLLRQTLRKPKARTFFDAQGDMHTEIKLSVHGGAYLTTSRVVLELKGAAASRDVLDWILGYPDGKRRLSAISAACRVAVVAHVDRFEDAEALARDARRLVALRRVHPAFQFVSVSEIGPPPKTVVATPVVPNAPPSASSPGAMSRWRAQGLAAAA